MAETLSSVTLPLKCEIWQADLLTKKFRLCQQVYNAMLEYELKQYNKMLHDKRYIAVMDDIRREYARLDSAPSEEAAKTRTPQQKRPKAKKERTPELQSAFQVRNDLIREYGFSKFSFTTQVKDFYSHFAENIASITASRSIAVPMWAAFEKLLFRDGKKVSFKRVEDFSSMTSDGKSGIRLVDEKGDTLIHGTPDQKMFCYVSTRKSKRPLRIPVMVPKNDIWKLQMIDRDIRTLTITRKLVRGTYKYYLTLCVVGASAPKIDCDGVLKHETGTGKVGIYIDTRSVTAYANGKYHTFALNEGIEHFEDKKAKLQAYLDTSRRLSNPDNYYADGTVKNGIVKNGVRRRLTWTLSNNYRKARAALSDLYRKEHEQRVLERNKLANTLLSLGDEFYINDYPFQAAAKRKTETETTESGRPKSKEKAGKAVGENAPSMLITLLNRRLVDQGKEPVQLVKLENVNKTDDYRKRYACELAG